MEGVKENQGELSDFKVAKIIKADKHPNADKLKLCEVSLGENQHIKVVCGAENARDGLISVYAPPGAIIPKTKMKIKKAKIRGITSYGMLCSGEELNIDSDFDGIIELDDEKPGEKVINVLDNIDPIIEIAITPNRPDCLGVYGIARDLSAKGVGNLKEANIQKVKSSKFQSFKHSKNTRYKHQTFENSKIQKKN